MNCSGGFLDEAASTWVWSSRDLAATGSDSSKNKYEIKFYFYFIVNKLNQGEANLNFDCWVFIKDK